MTPDREVRELREQIVRRHMESENLHVYFDSVTILRQLTVETN